MRNLLIGLLTLALLACGGSVGAPPASVTGTESPGTAQQDSSSTPAPAATVALPDPEPDPAALSALRAIDDQIEAGDYENAAAAARTVAATSTDPATQAAAHLSEGIARWAAGDRTGALALFERAMTSVPEGDTRQRAAYILARRLNELGRAEQALAVTPVARGHTVLGPLVAIEEWRANTTLGRASDWRALVFSTALPVVFRAQVASEEGRTALAAGDPAEAVAALGAEVALQPSAEARWRLALAQEAAGDAAARTETLVAIVTQHPGDARAVEAVAALRAAGVTIDPFREGLALYRGGVLEAAEDALRRAVSAGATAEAQFYLAASVEDQGRYVEAVSLYDRVLDLAPEPIVAHRAQYWAARSLEAARQYEAASARYSELAASGPAGPFTADAAFRAGYVVLSVDSRAAVSAWRSVPGTGRVLFWLGRELARAGETAAATDAYQRATAAAADPLYAYLARCALGEPCTLEWQFASLAGPVEPDWAALEAAFGAPSERARVIAALAGTLNGLGMTGEAAALLSAPEDAPGDALSLARAAHEAGHYDVARTIAQRLGPEAAQALGRILAPVGFAGVLVARGSEANVHPLLIAALVTVESAWDTDAVSPAGAVGLGQVLPGTGAGLLEARGQSLGEGELQRPAVSLDLAATYLAGELVATGRVEVALAAYNAGPGAARTWGARQPDLAAFIEGIPYEETRRYVRDVLDWYLRYRALYP
jgi:soluble lytic murein transglycosylase